MEEFLHNFHFIRPWLLLLAILPAVLYGVYFKGVNAQSSWQKVIDERLLSYLLVKGSAAKRQIFIITFRRLKSCKNTGLHSSEARCICIISS